MTFLQTMFPGKLSLSQTRRVAVATIALIFLFLFLMIIIPATTIPHYYGKSGWVSSTVSSTVLFFTSTFCLFPISLSAWCWIANGTAESSRLKIGSEYAYFWLAASVTFVLYGIIVINWLREATAKRDRRLLRDAIYMGWSVLRHRHILQERS
jgi:hypothetical protein